ncbi:MAG TPA: SurA N-terminal domain-containing protein, partial [Holophaga sp.]|nr:SurA N-terminal domain-containing protein [Holophaga sp.]
MSPVSRHDRESTKTKAAEAPKTEHRTPLRMLRNTFKGNQTPMAVLMMVVLLGMVAYLAPSGRNASMPDDTVARVYGRSVLRRDVEQALSDMLRRMGNQQNAKAMLPYLQAQAVRRLVDTRIYEEMAERRGLLVTDQEVKAGLESKLRQYKVFLTPDNKPRPTSEIVSILRENGIGLLQWEQEVRDQLLIQKLIERVAAQVPIDDAWVAMEDRVENEKITFEASAVAPDLAAVQDPGDATLEAYLKASGARFQYGPRRVLDYVALDQAAFADAIKIDDATLKSAYETKKLQYTELD